MSALKPWHERRNYLRSEVGRDGLNQEQMNRAGGELRWLLWYIVAIFIAVAVLAFVGKPASAQDTPPMDFGANVRSANGELTTTLTWDAPGAQGCRGIGHEAWAIDHPASGTFQLPTISRHGTYSVAIACSWAGDTSALISWQPVTQNTDGTPYENQKGYFLHYGQSAAGLAETVALFVPIATEYLFEDLEPGTWYFCVRAVNTLDVQSECSAVVSKTTTAGVTHEESLSLTVNPKPMAPTGLAAQ